MSGYSPEQRPRPFDTVELAKSGQSKCKLCNTKIPKGAVRAAIHVLNRGKYWNCGYYHQECMKTTKGIELLKRARFENSRSGTGRGHKRKGGDISQLELFEIDAERAKKRKRESEETVHKRGDLRETLRKIRLAIARHYDHAAFIVFNNVTLDALVEQLPCNEAELIKVNGFGPKKTASLGPFILPIINAYKRLNDNDTTRSSSARNLNPLPSSPGCVTEFKSSHAHAKEEEVIFESEVSIDEMINRKIKEAEERGEVIVLDM